MSRSWWRASVMRRGWASFFLLKSYSRHGRFPRGRGEFLAAKPHLKFFNSQGGVRVKVDQCRWRSDYRVLLYVTTPAPRSPPASPTS
ncbi:hypothetical protein ACFPJ1_38825 [Kribbella qitaiheensis]|uniref:hypothetical protein n=1 Tax=Kribbella qitaiheensis TaxID=1544730 RepID=UPI003605EC29